MTSFKQFRNSERNIDASTLQESMFQTGMWTALPYLAMSVVSVLAGLLGNSLLHRRVVSLTRLRKVFATVGKRVIMSSKCREFYNQKIKIKVQP